MTAPRADDTGPRAVAVTGASGYIGKRLVEGLLEQPNVERILGVDLRPRRSRMSVTSTCSRTYAHRWMRRSPRRESRRWRTWRSSCGRRATAPRADASTSAGRRTYCAPLRQEASGASWRCRARRSTAHGQASPGCSRRMRRPARPRVSPTQRTRRSAKRCWSASRAAIRSATSPSCARAW